MTRFAGLVSSAAVLIVLSPSLALAQATIAGVIRDSSGAVLPGVTVEATSPSLTEKMRSAVSDDTGQYRIVTLPPGTYAVTFSLAGFTTVKRENVSVAGSGVIPINADLRLGSLEETVTVTGASPIVDTQTTRRETVVNAETINALPITRNYGGVLYATPGLTVQPGVNNNALMPGMSLFSAHGGISTEGRVFVDGVSVNGPFGQNSVTQFAFDVGNAQEMQVLVGGGLGESETGGPVANIIPKSGGNALSGNFFISTTRSALQGNNVTTALQQQGIAAAPIVRQNWDGSAGVGGPLLRDRLWYFANVRSVGIAQVVAAGLKPNLHLGDASQWIYAPDPSVETRFTESKLDFSARLTGQVTPRNRLTFSYQPQYRCLGSTLTSDADGCRVRGDDWIGAPFGSETIAPEAGPGYQDGPVSLTQGTWTSTISNRHLVDAALSRFWYGIIGSGAMPPDAPMGFVGVTEASNRYNNRPNVSYRAPYGWGEYDTISWNWRAAWSYVTGGHSAKLGYQGTQMKYDWVNYTNPSLMRYTVNSSLAGSNPNNPTPTAVSYTITEEFENANRAVAHSFFLQDQWTRGRMTLQGALRYDYVYSWAPAEGNGTDGTSRFSSGPIRFERTDSVTGYHDLSPRFGLAFDLFGNGKTALKASAGRYLSAATADGIYSSQSPAGNFVRAVTNRAWTDSNGNRVVDCDLLSIAAQNAAATGGDVCGPLVGNNLNFGNQNPNIARVDPDILHGFGIRPYNWRYGLSLQQQVLPRVAVEVGYNRRHWGNFFVTYNELVDAASYDTLTVPVPGHPNLPNAGGTETYVIIKPEAAALGSREFQTLEQNVAGEGRTAYWHGFDTNATTRAGALTVQVGTTTGRGVRNLCALWQARPQLSIVSPGLGAAPVPQPLDACDVNEPWLTTVRGLASYQVPKLDVLVSTTFRSARAIAGENASNGVSLNANYQMPNSYVATLLGRLPAGQTANQTTTVNLLAPSELYPLTRRNEVDVRVAKILRFAGARLDVGLDIYNLLNANTTTTYQQTYVHDVSGGIGGAGWLNPTAILGPRLARLNATLSF